MDEMRCILAVSLRRVHSLAHQQDTIPKLRKHCRAGGIRAIMQHLVDGGNPVGVHKFQVCPFKAIGI